MGPQDKTLPQLSEQDKCCRTLMNELASAIAELSFLHVDSSHELRTKLRACQTTGYLQDLLSESKFQNTVEGSATCAPTRTRVRFVLQNNTESRQKLLLCALSNAMWQFHSLAIAMLLPVKLPTLVQHEYTIQISRNRTRVTEAQLFRLPCHTFRLLHSEILASFKGNSGFVSFSTVSQFGEPLLVCD